MVTFKTILGEPKKDGTRPVIIRVTHQRCCRKVRVGIFADKNQVTPTGKIKDQHIISMCEQIIIKWRRKMIDLAMAAESMSVDAIVEYLTHDNEKEETKIYFFDYAKRHIAKLVADGREGNAHAYTTAVNSLIKFTNSRLTTDEMTVDLVQRWVDFLAKTTKGRAPSLYFANIRAIWNKMRLELNDEDNGIIPIPNNPFAKVKPPKAGMPEKRALTAEQMRKLLMFPRHTNAMLQKDHYDTINLARDIFILSFLLVGMNLADMFECGPIENGRITYERKKTRNRRNDRAEISILVQPEAQRFIAHYNDDKRLLAFHKRYSTVNALSAAVNKGLKVIGKEIGVDHLTLYAARHTWATIAVNDCKIDKYTVHLALNHVDQATAITDVYIKKDFSLIDDANRKVIDFICDVT